MQVIGWLLKDDYWKIIINEPVTQPLSRSRNFETVM